MKRYIFMAIAMMLWCASATLGQSVALSAGVVAEKSDTADFVGEVYVASPPFVLRPYILSTWRLSEWKPDLTVAASSPEVLVNGTLYVSAAAGILMYQDEKYKPRGMASVTLRTSLGGHSGLVVRPYVMPWQDWDWALFTGLSFTLKHWK